MRNIEAWKARNFVKQSVTARIIAESILLNPWDKLAKLDARLGVGVGAKKERARLGSLRERD